MSSYFQGQTECPHLWEDGWCSLCGLGWGAWSQGEIDRLRDERERLTQSLYEAQNPMLPNGETTTVGEMYVQWQKAEAVVRALDRCEDTRGAFSCHEPHDARCPKSRADSPEKWKGEWICKCGREELDRALAAYWGKA